MQHMLIVATSGRALAQCAARSGFSSVVLDCFADADTRVIAESASSVADHSGVRFDGYRLLETAERLSPPADTDAMVYGAGFESDPALLESFARRYPLCGNPPEVVRLVKNPETLFPLLDEVGLPYPDTRLDPPATTDGWLIKRIGGAGGQHVQHCGLRPFESGRDYFQRAVPGTVSSVLFLADKRRAQVIGVSEALPPGDGFASPFAYSGAVSHAAVPPGIRDELSRKLDTLVAVTGLVGLNGIDFVVDRDSFRVLEINPRPTATLELYDPDVADGLLNAHVSTCLGEPVSLEQFWGPVRAHAIVFARLGFRLPSNWRPAPWCSDVPYRDALVSPGMPICSVRAEGSSHAEVLSRISLYRAAVLESCEGAMA
ncbi:MAG: ATP-grasp domain-containing protein [Candidatus Methylophosphatis roskildensis]